MSDWWSPSFQTTIDAFYQGGLHVGRNACERLLSVAGVPAQIEEQTRRNAVFYAPLLAETAPSPVHQPIEIEVPDGWSRFNPSIAADPEGDGLHLIVRSSNYSMTRQLRYTVHDDSGIIRTTNYLLALSPDLAIRDVQPIDDAAFRIEPPPFPVAGFEDCRLFWHRDAWHASATVRDRDAKGICQTALLRLEDATAVALHLLSDGLSRHEKNWMPAPDASQDVLRFVYSCHPTVITRYDDATGSVVPEVIQPGPLVARRFSGGSQAIPCDGGWLCLVHEAANFDDGGRVYTHRWVWFDTEWRLSRLSLPFLFQERGIEFAGGLARRGDDLIVSYGVGDRDAWLATVPIAEILPLLAPPLDSAVVEAEMRAAAAVEPAPAAATEDVAEQPAAPILDADFAPIPPEPLTEGGSSLRAPVSASRAPLPSPWAGHPLGGGWGEGRPEPEQSRAITPFVADDVSIVSMTLTGNSETIIGDALRSIVDWVDWVLVVDTGVSDDTLRIARDIARDKLVVRQFSWRDDFAAARNFALAAAAELGAAWAVTLDTDERIAVGEIDLRAALAEATADVLHVKHEGGTYGKERCFRLPARGQFVGPTHEAFIVAGGGSATLEGVRFAELGKSPEQYRQKAERDIAILSRHTAAHPDDPRWFYYLGDSLAGLGRHDEAIAAFRTCASLNGWDEEGAWAMYRAAESLLKLDRPVEAVEACAIGMSRHAGLAELPWLAAYASWQAGKPAQAAHWARVSVGLGHFAGSGAAVPRIGFRHPPALWEGPFDVLRFALRALGDESGADEAERLFQRASEARRGGTAISAGSDGSIRSLGVSGDQEQASGEAPAAWHDVLAAPAFLINLDRNSERKAMSCLELKRGGFSQVVRFAAIDGQSSPRLAEAWRELGNPGVDPTDAAFSSSPGRQGCLLSHLLIWKSLASGSNPFAGIFEDDIVLHRDWHGLAPLFYAATPKDFDVLFMGSRIENPTDSPVQAQPSFSTNAYLITRTGARKLLSLILEAPAGVATLDVMINRIQKRALRQDPETGGFTWYNWNASSFADPNRSVVPAVADRNIGLVFQNGLLGSEVDGWQMR
ncbi:MAG: uncharacterized protein K0S78_1339 [Thermomicrobiales bacterium]|nr:uncharacterized protein [Thermomicrobiales bacterium]